MVTPLQAKALAQQAAWRRNHQRKANLLPYLAAAAARQIELRRREQLQIERTARIARAKAKSERARQINLNAERLLNAALEDMPDHRAHISFIPPNYVRPQTAPVYHLKPFVPPPTHKEGNMSRLSDILLNKQKRNNAMLRRQSGPTQFAKGNPHYAFKENPRKKAQIPGIRLRKALQHVHNLWSDFNTKKAAKNAQTFGIPWNQGLIPYHHLLIWKNYIKQSPTHYPGQPGYKSIIDQYTS